MPPGVQYLFSSAGRWVAFRLGNSVFDTSGKWVGWLPCFAIPAAEISSDLAKLQEFFQARNEIAREMDILPGQPNRGRRQLREADMKDDAAFVLATALAFYTAVENRL